MIVHQLLPLARLGEHSITMAGEDEFGTAYFVDQTTPTLGDPPREQVSIDVDLPIGAVERARPDFLQTTKGIPLFSERFLSLAGTDFADEVDLNPGEAAADRRRAGVLRGAHPEVTAPDRSGGVGLLRDPGDPDPHRAGVRRSGRSLPAGPRQ